MTDGTASTAFFDRTYREALQLLLEARYYVADREATDRVGLGAMDRLRVSRETLRLTTRLTSVMAWLLTQKAVHAGELSRAEAAGERYRLAGQSVCFDDASRRDEALPPALRGLLDRSRRLYVRVARLDELVHRDGPPPG